MSEIIPPPPKTCVVCGSILTLITIGGQTIKICPACQGGSEKLDLTQPVIKIIP